MNGNWLYRLDVRAKLLFLVVFVVAALHARTPAALAVCLACSLAVSVAAGVTGRDAARVLKPLLPIVVITLAAQLLASQQTAATATDAVVWLGPFGVTARALYEAVRMVASLLAIMLMSVAFMRATGQEELVDAVRWLLSPLRVVGVRTDAFVFSLAAAIRFLPVLLDDFARLKRAHVARGASFDGGLRNRLESYVRLFAPLVNGSFRRADTLAAASVARGLCCSDRPTSLRVPHFGVAEGVVIAASAALLAFVLVA